MLSKSRAVFSRLLNSKGKRRLVAFFVMLTGITLGYLSFLMSWLSGFFIARYVAGKETGKRGKLPSVVLRLGKYDVHLHHWFMASVAMVWALFKGCLFFPANLFYGLLSGIAFQGIYSYKDWHKILIFRRGKNLINTKKPESQSCHNKIIGKGNDKV